MKTPQKFQLIDGIFSPAEAQQVLGVMVKGKIDFHSLEKHSENERSGGGMEKSGSRLAYLRDLDGRLKALADEARASGKRLKVTGEIQIEFID
ncbi:hypothetical protein HZ994_09625 [Akkermansiaceae bacterium]|nr:hypothetical protein HZ994_09625 [Akkermansiaceae bacterium]